VIDALGEIDREQPAVVETLIAALDDKEWAVRKTATAAVAELGPQGKAAVPRLLELLESEDDRDAVQSALREIDEAGPEAAPALIEILEDRDRRMTFLAVRLLGKIGPPAKDALPLLREMTGRRGRGFGRFGDMVEDAIRQIEGRPEEGDDDGRRRRDRDDCWLVQQCSFSRLVLALRVVPMPAITCGRTGAPSLVPALLRCKALRIHASDRHFPAWA
jgi:hypothetical protein